MQFPVLEGTQIPTRARDTCCREEMATMLLLLPSLPDNLAAKHVGYTLKARQDECRFPVLSFIILVWSWTQSWAVDGCPCPGCSWAHHPFGLRGWPGILKLKASFDVMTLKPCAINGKFFTVAINQLFPQVLWYAMWSCLYGCWRAPNESSFAFISQWDVFHSVRT